MIEVRGNPLVISGLFTLTNGILLCYHFTRGEMDAATVFLVLFLASIAASAFAVYKLSQKKTRESVWNWIILGFLASMLLLIGVVSRNVVTMLIGAFLLLGSGSSFLTSYVRSDHIIKRALEVILMLLAFGVVIYGYVVTGSYILGVITLLIVAMVIIAFTLSYLLPKIRSKSRGYSQDHLKEE
jgi:drug/metabolite transporter (DMT)-like permease